MYLLDLGSNQLPEHNTSLCLGFFDGVHIGHQKIIKTAIEIGREQNLKPALLTFSRHPIETIHGGLCFPYITTEEEKICIAEALGIFYYISVDFDNDFSSIPPLDFIHGTLLNLLRGKFFVVGRDYRFGNLAAGNVEMLRREVVDWGARVKVIEDISLEGEKIGSTSIREKIMAGELDWATSALGRWYSIEGEVISGNRRGRHMGIPTANIELPNNKVMPRPGVYEVFVLLKDKILEGIGHVGNRPTFDERHYNIEINLFNFSGNIYGENIRVFFVKYLRPTIHFDSADTLMKQVKEDIALCKKDLALIRDSEFLQDPLFNL